MKRDKIGIYIRLSYQDEDKMKARKDESGSVTAQRTIINTYLDSQKEFHGCERREFVDDGYSGTNFERPSFEKLMEEIRKMEINVVIVKDFSRFGRDYIELGDYLENIFPYLGVRFISVNDTYDSADYKGTTGGLDVIMKNIIYDYYSKDLSAKVRSSKDYLARQGKYMGPRPPYGMMFDPKDKTHLIPDPESGKIVRKIFDMALEGKKTSEIARWLNDNQVQMPADQMRERLKSDKNFHVIEEQRSWTRNKVNHILKQKVYCGWNVARKRTRVRIGSTKTYQTPKDECIIVKNAHVPIVTEEEQLRAEKVIQTHNEKKPKSKIEYPLRAKVVCGNCGCNMRYRHIRTEPYYWCETNRLTKESQCTKDKFVESDLNKVVFAALQGMIAGCLERYADARKKIDVQEMSKEKNEKEIAGLQKDIEKEENEKFRDLNEYLSGKMDPDTFTQKKTAHNLAIERCKLRIEELSPKQDEEFKKALEETEDGIKQMQSYAENDTLTTEMVDAFIDRVIIYSADNIKVKFKLSDPIREILGIK